MPDRDPRVQPSVRVIVSRRAMADLMVAVAQPTAKPSMHGLFVKTHNDQIPIRFLPEAELTEEVVAGAQKTVAGELWVTAERLVDADLSIFRFTTQGAIGQLSLPILDRGFSSNYFNVEWSRLTPVHSELLSIMEATPTLMVRPTSDRDEPTNYLFSATTIRQTLWLTRNLSFTLNCRGDAYQWGVVLRCISCDPEPSEVLFEYRNGVMTLYPGKDVHKLHLCAFVHPVPGRNLVSGRRTIGFSPADLTIGIFPPFGPRLFHLLCAAPGGPKHMPVAWMPLLEPHAVTVNLLMGDPDGKGLLMSGEALEVVRSCSEFVMVGDPSFALFEEVLSSSFHEELGLVSASPELLTAVGRKYGWKSARIRLGDTVSLTVGRKTVHLLEVPADHTVVKKLPVIERLFLEMSDRVASRRLPADLVERQIQHSERRLPALPFCIDLAVGLVALVGDMLRGRIPSDAGVDSPNYDVYANDELWMVPWQHKQYSRSELIFELNARNASEYLAARCFLALVGTSEQRPVDASLRIQEEDQLALCAEWYERWEQAATEDAAASGAKDKLTAYINGDPSHAETTMRCIAKLAYQACTGSGRYSNRSPHETKLSFLNPLVLILAGGGDEDYDHKLDFNAPYWAMYAGRCDSLNARGIVASLVHQSNFVGLVQLLKDVRRRLQAPEIDSSAIFSKRRELGAALASTVEEATYEVLAKLAPSRIVVFSEIPLDYLPFRGSMLGLEIPILRYPISLAYAVVNDVSRSSARTVAAADKHLCSVLCAKDGYDRATLWASETGRLVGNLLSTYFGRDVLYPATSYDDSERILQEAARSQIVVFLGHAGASERGARLDLGTLRISLRSIKKQKWTDSFVFLIGCETAAVDSVHGDIAETFLASGARCVVGSLTRLPVYVADVFFQEFVQHLSAGASADYSFFFARRKAVLFEALCSTNEREAAKTMANSALDEAMHKNFPACGSFKTIAAGQGLEIEQVLRNSPTALSLTILGGAGERLL